MDELLSSRATETRLLKNFQTGSRDQTLPVEMDAGGGDGGSGHGEHQNHSPPINNKG